MSDAELLHRIWMRTTGRWRAIQVGDTLRNRTPDHASFFGWLPMPPEAPDIRTNIWKESHDLVAYLTFSFFILLTVGVFCAPFRWNHAAHAMCALCNLTRVCFQWRWRCCHCALFIRSPVQMRTADPVRGVTSGGEPAPFLAFHVSKPYLLAFSTAMMVLWLYCASMRQYVLLQTINFITDDMSAYNRVWERCSRKSLS